MIAGTGIDLIEVGRIRRILEKRGDRFIEKVFTEEERAYCARQKDPAVHFAARFAAKESCLKALGLGMGYVGWKEMEVISSPSGQPELNLRGKGQEMMIKRGIARLFLSLSHTPREAVAVVIAEGVEK
ncbi:MAG TPA: holo-ACP synthase [Syntrophales bacterium]|nr:holo-ACP synthase [Syntrophales bacterium]HOL59740.1 holo-ACP synthase [Syntrophales bacterium]HPO35886.1 holo-ACP synthase [Syntrophales bacterium]